MSNSAAATVQVKSSSSKFPQHTQAPGYEYLIARSSGPGIYDDISIGNFLVGFGLAMGFRHKEQAIDVSEMCVNLAQQTPSDKAIGDVLLEGSGILRVLEFKRAGAKSTKERSKAKLLTWALKAPELAHLELISREIHWYVETTNAPPQIANRIIPYLDLRSDTHSTQNFSGFLESAVKAAGDGPTPAGVMNQYREYFQLLLRCQGRRYGASGNWERRTAALVIHLEDRQLRYVATDDLRNIFLTGKEREIEGEKFSREIRQEIESKVRKDIWREDREAIGIRKSSDRSRGWRSEGPYGRR